MSLGHGAATRELEMGSRKDMQPDTGITESPNHLFYGEQLKGRIVTSLRRVKQTTVPRATVLPEYKWFLVVPRATIMKGS